MAKKKDTTEETAEKLIAKMKPAHVRFLLLYMGMEDGKCWNNATKAYLEAFEIETPTHKIKHANGTVGYSNEYKSAKSSAFKLLTTADITKLRHFILLKQGYTPESIKKRYTELQLQNRNPIVALNANDRMAKIAGVIDENKKVNIPELENLGNAIRDILTPKK